MEIKNILIGKIGKSIKFKKSSWQLSGGNEGIYNLILLLGNLNPDKNFYISGQSDYYKLSESEKYELFPNNNVFQLPLRGLNYNGPINYIRKNNIKIDVGLIMHGMSTYISIPNKFTKKDSNEYIKTLNWANRYSAPIIHTLNELQIPYITLSEDPRNTKLDCKDLFNQEKKCLSLENSFYDRRHITNYENIETLINHKVPVVYGNIELLCLYGKKKYNISTEYNRDILISIFMNKFGIDSKTTRKPFIKEYILSNYPDTKIYGLWKEETENNESSYINKKMVEIPDILYRTKYTVIKSLKKDFISGKPWEMINYGILPFLSPDYDGNKLLPLPDYLYLTSPQDLVNKINYLEQNPEEYKSLINECSQLLKDEYFSGEFLNNKFMEELNNLVNK